MRRKAPVIGLALGGGSARGWAHIGVIRALAEIGIHPHVVCGTSVGALVAAIYANGDLDWLEEWVGKLTWQAAVRLLDLRLTGGLLGGLKLIGLFGARFRDRDIADLQLPFTAVATELDTGREVWIQQGRVIDAVRASIAIPGLFTPALHEGIWLVDGGLTNPVPVSVARAMKADIVIAVDLNHDIVGGWLSREPQAVQQVNAAAEATFKHRLRSWLSSGREPTKAPPPPENREIAPSLFTAMEKGINIMQVRITRSRLAGEPADIMITPRLGRLGLMDFHRGREAIEEGRAAVARALPVIRGQIPLLSD